LTATAINYKQHHWKTLFPAKICLEAREVHRMDENPGGVLTIDELAAYLKIPKSTLYKLVREGKIPSQKIGRHWRFRKQAIDLWLDETRANKPDPG
jgi:excisionase family DNA binding protein